VLFDPSTLQSDLVQYGIPAKVTTGSFCSSDPAPGGFSQAVTFSPVFQGDSGQQVRNPTVTINPATMPAGTELSVGAFQVSHGYDTALALINTNSYTCTSTAPTTPPSSGALLHLRMAPQSQAPSLCPSSWHRRPDIRQALSNATDLPRTREDLVGNWAHHR